MDIRRIAEVRLDGIESPAGRPIRDIDPEIIPDGIDNGIGCPEGDGPIEADAIPSNSLIPHFGSIENYQALRRQYPDGIPGREIGKGC